MGGTITGTGTLEVANELLLSGANPKILDNAYIRNRGVIEFRQGSINGAGVAKIENTIGADFNINCAADCNINSNTTGAPQLINEGNINVLSNFSTASISFDFKNIGTVNVLHGATLRLNGRGELGGLFNIYANSKLRLASPALGYIFSTQSQVHMDSSSAFEIYSGEHYYYGLLSCNGSTSVLGGLIHFLTPARIVDFGSLLSISGGQLAYYAEVLNQTFPDVLITGGLLDTFDRDIILPSLTMDGTGIFERNGLIDVIGMFQWSGGTLQGTGSVVSRHMLYITSAKAKTLQEGLLVNNLDAVWINGSVSGQSGAAFVNNVNATLSLDVATSLSWAGAATLINYGTIRKTQNSTTTIEFSLQQDGLLEVLAPGLVLAGDGYFSSTSHTTIFNNAWLRFSGVNPYIINGTITTRDTASLIISKGLFILNGLLSGRVQVTGGSLQAFGEMALQSSIFSGGSIWVGGLYNNTNVTIVSGTCNATFAPSANLLNLGSGVQVQDTAMLYLHNNALPSPVVPITISDQAILDLGAVDFIVPVLSQRNSSTLSLGGTLTVTSKYTLSGGTVTTSYNGIINCMTDFTLDTITAKALQAVVINVFTAGIWQGGTITGNSAAIINILENATMTLDSSLVSLAILQGSGVSPRLINHGLLAKIGAFPAEINFVLENHRTVQAHNGTLTMTGGGLHTGGFQIAGTATLEMGGGNHEFALPSVVSNSGTFSVSGGSTFFEGLLANSGSGFTATSGGAFYLMPSAVVTTFGANLTITGGTTILFTNPQADAIVIVQGGTLDYSYLSVQLVSLLVDGANAVVTKSGTVTVMSTFDFRRGTIDGYGRIVSTGDMLFQSGNLKTISRGTIANKKSARWIDGQVLFSLSATLINDHNATFSLEAASSFMGAGQFLNLANIVKSGNVRSQIYIDFVNSGTVIVSGGTLTHAGTSIHNGFLSVLSAATLEILQEYFLFTPSSHTSGAGKISVAGGVAVIESGANFTMSGMTETTAGYLHSFEKLNVFGSPLLVNGTGTTCMQVDTSISTLQVVSGTLSGPAELVVTTLMKSTCSTHFSITFSFFFLQPQKFLSCQISVD